MASDSRPRVLPEAALDAMPGAIAQVDDTGVILGVNAAWRTLADRSELLPSTNVTTGSNYLVACEQAAEAGVAPAREAATAVRAVLNGREQAATFEYTLAGRETKPCFECIVTRLGGDGFHGALVRHVDISTRKRLETRCLRAQKMEGVARLAGGIAHDFNNLLTVMVGYAELLHTSEELPAAFRPAVTEILDAARRAADLTGRMLTFALKQRVQPGAVNVNEVVRGVDRLLRRCIGDNVRLELRLAHRLAPVPIDPAQLEQVLMQLAVNGRDAMPAGGTLTITSEAVDLTEEDARHHPGLGAGPHVRISVVDTGVGMDAEMLARLFEPFFTTKEAGKGTGLGLAICYGIVRQANGFIECESVKGAGTTCTVLLPAAAAAADRPN